MCGICGVFEYGTGRPVDGDLLARMNQTLVHRGPDDEGYLIRPGLGLASRRLSIIDLAGGHQPMANEEETVWILFNGEIYNFEELRAGLLRRGHRFRTRSDTEVVLHLYEDDGAGCLDHLDGMFAFAVYDNRCSPGVPRAGQGRGRLLLARDRLGKKPLYYADLGNALLFASEIKPILCEPRVSRDLDFEALYHYLSLLVVPAPYSIFRAIRKLPAGHVLECDLSGVRVRRYWGLSDSIDNQRMPEEDAVREIRRLLFRAVEKRLVSDVPLGAFLSGGLDSSTVVAIMTRLKSEPVRTFSIGFEAMPSHSELSYARTLSRACATDHHEFVFKPTDVIDQLPELVRYADEPLAISSAAPTYLLAKAARQHVTVALTGDGGDEAFGGYEHYLYERWAATYRHLPQGIDRSLVWLLSKTGNRRDASASRPYLRAHRFIQNARQSAGQRRLGWSSGWSEGEKHELLRPEARLEMDITSPIFLEGRTLYGSDPIGAQMQMDTLVWLPDEMLAKVDRMTMAASIEGRCPLLDVPLMQFMFGLHPEMKVPGWRKKKLKHLLRRAVADLLPPELVRRPKHGFNVPLDAWFRQQARPFLESMLSPERIRRRGIFEPSVVSGWLQRHASGTVNASNRLYALLVFEIWAQTYLP